jgi:hypothetical protein
MIITRMVYYDAMQCNAYVQYMSSDHSYSYIDATIPEASQ